MARGATKEFKAAFANLTDAQQDEVRALTQECSKVSSAYKAACDTEQRIGAEQRRTFMKYEKRCRAMGLPVPMDICFR